MKQHEQWRPKRPRATDRQLLTTKRLVEVVILLCIVLVAVLVKRQKG